MAATTSQESVVQALEKIEKYNSSLKALISILPHDSALKHAKSRDLEIASGRSRGPLDGIPIVVKDTICTPSSGLPTTCGSYALKEAAANGDATVTTRLVDAGMIILGKSNITAFGKASKAGWSAPGGQTQSPYIKVGSSPGRTFQDHDSPSGSSSGSAVAVAASFVPAAISAETEESTVSPSGRVGIFGLKATHGSIPMDGIQPYSPFLDCVGVMARTPDMILPVLNCLQGSDHKLASNSDCLHKSFSGMTVGVVNSSLWPTDEAKTPFSESLASQIRETTEAALKSIEANGARVAKDVALSSYAQITDGLLNIDQIVEHDFAPSQQSFLKGFGDTNTVTTLEEWIAFNAATPAELPADHPSQAGLEACIYPALSNAEEQQYVENLDRTRERAQGALNGILLQEQSEAKEAKALEGQKFDVLLGPADSRLAAVASLAGYPIACMPLGRWTQGPGSNGRCFGIYALSMAGRAGEMKLLHFMKAWEELIRRFEPPQL